MNQTRNRHVDTFKRNHIKVESKKLILETLTPLYDNKSKANTTLMELSERDYSRFKDNCINVSGISTTENFSSGAKITIYSDVTYGANVNKTKQKVASKWCNQINLQKTKRRFIMITAKKKECIEAFPNTYIFDTCMTDKKSLNPKTNSSKSGVVILMVAVLPSSNKTKNSNYIVDEAIVNKVRSCKSNIILGASYNHYGSFGECYAFGNRPNYGMVDDSSVTIFANKKSASKNPSKQINIDKNAKDVEDICANVVNNAVTLLSSVLPEIRYLLSPILDTGQKLQNKFKRSILKEVATTKSCFWNTMLYVDGNTQHMHTEKDCAYTLITVPKQSFSRKKILCNQPMFLFQASDKQQIMLPLDDSITFVYNATYLTHHQHYVPGVDQCNDKFINISSYGNEKLFNHLRKSLSRITINGAVASL